MGARFLKRNFGPKSLLAAKSNGEYRLLIFDGHNSHVNLRFFTYCLDNKVIPLCLPPHTTHRLQPLDVAIFSSYKHFYREEVRRRWAQREWGIGKENFFEIVSIARQKSFTAANIRSGFWNTGHIPVDKDIVLRNIPSPNSPPHTPEPSEDLPSPGHLNHLTAAEMTQFGTPTSIHQLQYQDQLLREAEKEENKDSPHSWKRRRIFTNITHAAQHSMLQAEERKHEITTILAAE